MNARRAEHVKVNCGHAANVTIDNVRVDLLRPDVLRNLAAMGFLITAEDVLCGYIEKLQTPCWGLRPREISANTQASLASHRNLG